MGVEILPSFFEAMNNIQDIREKNYRKVTDSMKGDGLSVLVGRLLLAQKYKLLPPEAKRITPSANIEDCEAYQDNGDIRFYRNDTIEIAEVKHHVPDGAVPKWNNRNDFVYRKVIVDGRYQFDRKKQIPFIYLIFNYDCSAYMCINVNRTIKFWEVGEKKQYSPNGYDKYYLYVPKELVSFRRVSPSILIQAQEIFNKQESN